MPPQLTLSTLTTVTLILFKYFFRGLIKAATLLVKCDLGEQLVLLGKMILITIHIKARRELNSLNSMLKLVFHKRQITNN